MTNDITGATFTFCEMHQHGSAFCDFLALRKRFFIDTLAWNIPHDDHVEMDQYDNPKASYSLALRNGQVVGGARLMKFTDRWGKHGCMLQDAVEGRLADIPETALPENRSYSSASECTRLVLSDRLTSVPQRESALRIVVDGLVDLARAHGSDELVTLTVPSFVRILRKIGYDAEQIGERYKGHQDGRTYAVLQMPANRSAHGWQEEAEYQMSR